MGWLLALDLPSVRNICLVTGDPPLIALDAADDRLVFFSADSGAFYGWQALPRPDGRDPLGNYSIAWLDTLRAPNGAVLPRVRIGAMTVLGAYDGRLHVIQSGERAVKLAMDGEPVDLLRDHAADVLVVGLDRELGTVGVLTDDGALHVFQQHVAVGTYSVGVARGHRPSVFLPDATGTIIVGDEERTRVFDMAGRLLAQAPCAAMLGAAEVAPAGEWIVRYGGMRGAIQAYDARLTAVRQGAGEDLRAASRSVQLFPAERTRDGEIEALAVADDGLLAFVQGQTLCCAHLSTLAPLPSEQALL